MLVVHHIETLIFEGDLIRVKIDGQLIELPISKVSEKLAKASEIERSYFKISPSGYGIHWPLIDEDLSVDVFIR